MTPRLGRIPYLNTEPFFADDAVRTAARTAPPRLMIDLALDGEVEIAPLPAVAAFDHPGAFEPVGGFGIAVEDDAKSVLLYTRHPVRELTGRAIGVTDETATSVRLLRVLLHERFDVQAYRFESLDARADGYLVIGDRALRDGPPGDALPHVIDLAAEWHAWTGLPFVFAYWMARRDTPPAAHIEAANYFEANLTRNLADPSILYRRRPDLGMSRAQVAAYVRTFNYRFDQRAWEGLERFRELDAHVAAREDAA